IRAEVGGEVPGKATLYRRARGRDWQLSPLLKDDDKRSKFGYTVSEAREDFDYYIVAGDARSPQYHVQVVKPPRIERRTVAQTLPAYAHSTRKVIDPADGTISDLAGTRIDLSIRPSKSLQLAQLQSSSGEKIDLTPSEDGTWSTSFVLWSKDAREVPGLSGRLLMADAG